MLEDWSKDERIGGGTCAILASMAVALWVLAISGAQTLATLHPLAMVVGFAIGAAFMLFIVGTLRIIAEVV